MCNIVHVPKLEDGTLYAHPLLSFVGDRIRTRREAVGLTVKDVAERSRLSTRFLVSLENGYGNVSLLNLDTVAHVLGTSIVDLVGGTSDERAESGSTRRALVTLIGLRGAGKSTLGSRAAAMTHLPFIELDERITRRAGLSAGEIFDEHGAQYYRRIERQELERIVDSGESAIVATAGSLVTDHATFELVLGRTTAVWLRATAKDHHDRVFAQGDLRPMQNRKDAMSELSAILKVRRALYERAPQVIDTSKLGLDRSVSALVKIVRDHWRPVGDIPEWEDD